MWPKKQVNKPLLNPATFCRTLCRGQNFKILQNPFAHCLQSVWGRPTQNSQSKRCCLGDHIPIWKQQELGGTYGIVDLLAYFSEGFYWRFFHFQPFIVSSMIQRVAFYIWNGCDLIFLGPELTQQLDTKHCQKMSDMNTHSQKHFWEQNFQGLKVTRTPDWYKYEWLSIISNQWKTGINPEALINYFNTNWWKKNH